VTVGSLRLYRRPVGFKDVTVAEPSTSFTRSSSSPVKDVNERISAGTPDTAAKARRTAVADGWQSRLRNFDGDAGE